MSKQITLYSDALGPNGWKVSMILNCLNISYDTIMVDVFSTGSGMPKSEFLKINPNGRIPAIVDHTADDFTLWESVAIIGYLAKRFDELGTLSFVEGDFKRSAEVDQFLLFQASGQGPYFGQLTWFTIYHSEKNLTSVIERYRDEVRRVNGVLESVLTSASADEHGQKWLVGGKCTVADLSFVIWTDVVVNWTVAMGESGFDLNKEFPEVGKWFDVMMKMDGVDRVRQEREAAKMRFK